MTLAWEDVPAAVEALAVKVAAPAWDVRRFAAGVPTTGDVGYFYDPQHDRVGLHPRRATIDDLYLCKQAAALAVGRGHVLDVPLTEAQAAGDDGVWVKVAYSPTLRRAGEYLNFFPGSYPGGIPNAPSPLAALLTTALVGGGLGYVGGRAVRAVLPDGVGKKLPRSGALAGMTAGSLLAAPWVAANLQQGKSLTDGSLLADREDDPPKVEGDAVSGTRSEPGDGVLKKLRGWDPLHIRRAGLPALKAIKESFDSVVLSEDFKGVLAKQASLFGGYAERQAPTPADVNIGSLGQTLWESGASDRLTTAALGTMYAASQLPDPNARPGWVTGHQLGSLAANAASNYVKGLAAGAVLNATVGTPWRAPAFGVGAAALGLIGAVIPRLFG